MAGWARRIATISLTTLFLPGLVRRSYRSHVARRVLRVKRAVKRIQVPVVLLVVIFGVGVDDIGDVVGEVLVLVGCNVCMYAVMCHTHTCTLCTNKCVDRTRTRK